MGGGTGVPVVVGVLVGGLPVFFFFFFLYFIIFNISQIARLHFW